MKKIFLLVFLLNFIFCYADSQLDEELFDAAENGDVKKVEELIKQGANVNAKDVEDYTALINASSNGHKEIVELLIKYKADVNAIDNLGWSVLMHASINGNKDIVKLLLKNKADINAKNKYGLTALMFASVSGHKDIVEILIKNNADINAKDVNSSSALGFASRRLHRRLDTRSSDKDIVQLLLKAGANRAELVSYKSSDLWFCNNGGYIDESCINKVRITFLNESFKRVTSITFNLEIQDVNGSTLYKKKHTVSVDLDHEEQAPCNEFWLSSSVYSSYSFNVPDNHTFNVEVLSAK